MKRKNAQQGTQPGRGATNGTKPENTPQTDKRAAPSTAWRPGESGNPGGRPKLTESQRQAREDRATAQPAAVKRLVSIIENPASEDRDAIAAAKVILEGLEPLKIALDANVTADLKHELKAEVVQSPERMQAIVAVLARAGQLAAKTETAAPVEEKPENA